MASLLSFVQVRHNTVNFFMRRTGRVLWKTVTSVSKPGQKKGRRSTRQPIRPLENFYRIGASPLNVRFPGLNAPARDQVAEEPYVAVEQTDEEFKEKVGMIQERLESRGKTRKRRMREKLYPLERGFSGAQVAGQRLGPPPSMDGVTFDGFESYSLEIKRVSHMTRVFGRVHRMSALVFTGNGKGLAGYAVGKAAIHRTANAIAKGLKSASRKLSYVELLDGRTIFQDFYAECLNTRIYAQRRPKGFGLICHPRLVKICDAIGIKDLYAKVEGNTKNYQALTHAFMSGLQNQETHEALAERTGLHVVEMSPNRNFLPQIIASPIKREMKRDEDVTPEERLDLEDYYGEGRQPVYVDKQKPFYENTPGHQHALWRKHPYRNHEKVQVRLMADDFVTRWTRDKRKEWTTHQDAQMEGGVLPIPQGLGLSQVKPKAE